VLRPHDLLVEAVTAEAATWLHASPANCSRRLVPYPTANRPGCSKRYTRGRRLTHQAPLSLSGSTAIATQSRTTCDEFKS